MTDVELENVSSIGIVRRSKPHWTTAPPAYAGWWAVRFTQDRTNRQIIYLDGPRQGSPVLEFSDRAYTWPSESYETEADSSGSERPRHSPYVTVIDNDLVEIEHSPTYWITLGMIIGACAITIIFLLLNWLVINH